MARTPSINNRGNVEWTEKATAPNGNNLVITLKLDAIDFGSGFTQQGTDSSNISWLDFSTFSTVNSDGSRDVTTTIEVDPGGISVGNDYRFEINADNGVLAANHLFILKVAASKVVDGTKLFILSENAGRIGENDLSTEWDITTANEVNSTGISITRSHGLEFSLDGKKMFITDSDNNDLIEYDLSSWDVTTKSKVQSVNIGTEPNGISLKDGLKFFVVREPGYVDSYALSSEYDISTLNSENTLDVTSEDTFMQDIAFKTDGGRMYLIGGSNDNVFEYNLTTAWDISTASIANSFDISNWQGNPEGLTVKDDGTRIYICGTDVQSFEMSSPWDLSTASYKNTLSRSQDLTSIRFGI